MAIIKARCGMQMQNLRRGFGLCGIVFLSLVVLPLSPVRAQLAEDNDALARRLFEEGRRLFQSGDFSASARAFRRAYLLSPRPGLLYNLALAELRAGNDALALEAFEGFLRQAPPDDPHRSEVSERVRVLRSMGVRPASQDEVKAAEVRAAQFIPSGAEPESPPPPPRERTSPQGEAQSPNEGTQEAQAAPSTSTEGTIQNAQANTVERVIGDGSSTPTQGDASIYPWITLGGGVVLLIAGAILLGAGIGDLSFANDPPPGSRWANVKSAHERGHVLTGFGIALGVAGAVGAGAGLLWGMSESHAAPSTQSALLSTIPFE
ncbi:MAG: tetratricopeptide repeat protein [Sandaracinaceae bacterium]|nr:tetratricopeptide repeat protein [Sandaracinaceae bacterium]